MSFSQHLSKHLRTADADALAELYADDAEMLSFEFGSRSGRDAIREQYERFLGFHGEITQAETKRETASGDRLFFELALESTRGAFTLIHAVVLDGERAAVHFTNVIEGEVEADQSAG